MYLNDSPFIQNKGEMISFVGGRRNFIFQKESIYTFLLINNSLSNGNFKKINEKFKDDHITLGYNYEVFYPIVIWGKWVHIDTGFDFYETDKNNEVFNAIRREGNAYVSKPLISNSFDFFLEQHHFNDLEYIVENKIIERIPFMVEQ